MSEVQIKCPKCNADIVLPARPVNNSMTYCPALSRLRLFSVAILMTMLIHQGYGFEFEDPYADPKASKAPKTIESPKASEPPSISYVTPIEDTLILTPAPAKELWVQPMQTYRLIGKVNIGYLIIYPDDQGVYRTGIIPWKDRMNNLTVTEEGNILRIRPGTVAKIGQGGILLRANTPYPLVGGNNLQQKVQYCVGTFSQVVSVAKSKMQFVANTKAQYLLDELAKQDEAMSQYRPERVAVPQSKESNDGESDNHLANYLAEKEASRSHTLKKKGITATINSTTTGSTKTSPIETKQRSDICPNCGGKMKTRYDERTPIQRLSDLENAGEFADMIPYSRYCPNCSGP